MSSSIYSFPQAALYSFSGPPLILYVCTITSFKNGSMQLFAAAQTVKAVSSISVDPGIQHFSFTGILSVIFSGDFQLHRASVWLCIKC